MSKSRLINKKSIVSPRVQSKTGIRLKTDTLIENGRKEILTKKQLEKYPIGSLISYLNTHGVFRIGGYLKRFDDEYFVYTTVDFDKNIKVKYKCVSKMWVGSVYKCKNDVVSLIQCTNKKTKHYAKIGNITVYYTRDKNAIGRYLRTEKYQRMLKWYEKFGTN